jgi:glycosyltransferase involved in cell wall biosynthesis
VLTTCATSYTDWANTLAAGTELDGGVTVHRLPTDRPRDAERFPELSARVLNGRHHAPAHVQAAWLAAQGPSVPELVPWLRVHASRFDVVVCFTYLYATTWCAVGALAGTVPVVMHPTAHDEPPLRVPLHRRTFRLVDGLAVSTPEEADLVRERFAPACPVEVIGIGFDVAAVPTGAAARPPTLVCVGRMDASKGTPELVDWFARYKDRRPGPVRLVLIGDQVVDLPAHPDIDVLGVVDDARRTAVVRDATAAVVPSYFESFSMVLAEAWALSRPALVQGRCRVLAGQARRSGGALPYSGYAQFEAALDRLLADADLRRRLGAAGRAYVERHAAWDVVLDRYESFLRGVAAS